MLSILAGGEAIREYFAWQFAGTSMSFMPSLVLFIPASEEPISLSGDLKATPKPQKIMGVSVHLGIAFAASLLVLLLPPVALGRHAPLQPDHRGNLPQNEEFKVHKEDVTRKVSDAPAGQHARPKGDEKYAVKKDKVHQMLQIAGSNLPDCSHACGACFPCRRVSVSFKCSVTDEAESCPMAYRCMCKGKFFPIP